MSKILSVLSAMIIASLPVSVFAEVWKCDVTSYGALRGFDSSQGAKTWLPDVFHMRFEGSNIDYYYFDMEQNITNAKMDNTWLIGRSKDSVKTSQGVFLLKLKIAIDAVRHKARLGFTSSKSGYEGASATGYYNCVSQ